MQLSELALEILHAVPLSGALRPYAYAAWETREGEIEMGPVRARRALRDGTFEYECSPFPGAWDWHVPESAIRRVRSLQAMSLLGAVCECDPSNPYVVRCVAPECPAPVRR